MSDSEYQQPLQEYLSEEDLSEDLVRLQAKISELEARETEILDLIDSMEQAYELRRVPLEDKRNEIVEEKVLLMAELAARMPRTSIYPPARGPAALKFVDGGLFTAVCNTIVVLNLACMAFSGQLQAYSSSLYVIDQLFLVWYVLELTVKCMYHRCDLFYGNIGVVWWNWLDGCIVVGGVVDQWLMGPLQHSTSWKTPALSSWLRWLRLFRLMRFLKVLKAFVQGDLSWTESSKFQVSMTLIIALNSFVLALELDYDWEGWPWIEKIFLAIYTFELAVRLKRFGCHFFFNSDLIWNNLDFIMVVGGVFDQLVIPATQGEFHGTSDRNNVSLQHVLYILKMMKIIRVLRLVRLIRMVKPLYTLLVGVMSALDAMKWVMLLTIFVLYAGAIVFTILIGHGCIYSNPSEVPDEAETYFGSVAASFFSLFQLMNGDMHVVRPITNNEAGRLLFAGFMVLSNWAVLAILTSVVSDHMITSSRQVFADYSEREEKKRLETRTRRLKHFFSRLDTKHYGKIMYSQWHAVVNDPTLGGELCDLTNLDRPHLKEIVHCLTHLVEEGSTPKKGEPEPERYFYPEDFIAHLNHDQAAADRRHILHHRYCLEKNTLNRIQELEHQIQSKFDALGTFLEQALPSSNPVNPERTKNSYKALVSNECSGPISSRHPPFSNAANSRKGRLQL